jgi:hypothetical protein
MAFPLDYIGKPIKTLEILNKNSNSIVILYPGHSYSLKSPMFAFLIDYFIDSGFDILGFDYRYDENPEFEKCDDNKQDTWFEFDCLSIGKNVLERLNKYNKVIYVGKSLGTTMIMKQIENKLLKTNSTIIWLTPGIYAKQIYEVIAKSTIRSLIISGTADSNYLRKELNILSKHSWVVVKEIKKAGHSFEVVGDIEKTIENHLEVVKTIKFFLNNNQDTIRIIVFPCPRRTSGRRREFIYNRLVKRLTLRFRCVAGTLLGPSDTFCSVTVYACA